MIPLRDTIPSRRFPVINTMLIGVNVAVFMMEVMAGPAVQDIVTGFGLTPAYLLAHRDAREASTLLTSMFLHAGWMHLLSNMLALYIFGDNVEDRMGKARYLAFYLLCGLVAGATHIIFNPRSVVPTVGASGAIAGVLGAYLVMFPHARVLTLIPIFFLPWFVEIPAVLYLGIWFFSQLLNGTAALVLQAEQTHGGGIAFWAHAGGFVAGAALVFLFADLPSRRRRQSEYISNE